MVSKGTLQGMLAPETESNERIHTHIFDIKRNHIYNFILSFKKRALPGVTYKAEVPSSCMVSYKALAW